MLGVIGLQAWVRSGKSATHRRVHEGLSYEDTLDSEDPSNDSGEPGWLVLGRGYDQLIDYTVGYRTALAAMQSQPAVRDQAPGSDGFRPLHGADFVHSGSRFADTRFQDEFLKRAV